MAYFKVLSQHLPEDIWENLYAFSLNGEHTTYDFP
jgi:hypothetical protein